MDDVSFGFKKIIKAHIFIFSLFLLFGITNSKALVESPQGIDDIIKQSREKQLAKHPYWLKLVHYVPPFNPVNQTTYESDVISASFFLSENGRENPEAELDATLKAFFQPPGNNHDQHPQCRFIARFQWLKSQLDFSLDKLPTVTCGLFERWANPKYLKSISLVFVSAHMGNPASIYGHILLKINSNTPLFGHSLLSPTLNFGAAMGPNDGPLKYVSYGLFGGYRGRFSDSRFYDFTHMYGDIQLRDLWEYELDLSKEQQLRIVYHAWELLHFIDFQYYFLRENCAYRMAELIEYAWDTPKTNPVFSLYCIPADVFHRLKMMDNYGRPLIKKIDFFPSQQRRLRQKCTSLSSIEQKWAFKLAQQFHLINSKAFGELTRFQQAKIFDCLIDYFQYQLIKNDDPAISSKKQQILMLRSQLPAINNIQTAQLPLPPTDGHRPGRVRMGHVQNRTIGNAMEIGMMTSYHDFLAVETGFPADTYFKTLDLRLRLTHDKIILHSLEFVDILSLKTNPTGFPGNSGWSWRIRASIEPQNLNCEACRVMHVSGGLGKTISFYEKDKWWGMANIYIRTSPKTNQFSVGFSPSFGMTISPFDKWKLLFAHDYLTINEAFVARSRLENRLMLSKNWDVRLEWQKNGGEEIALMLHNYW